MATSSENFEYTYTFFLDLSRLIVAFAREFFRYLFTDVWTLISDANNSFTSWIFDLLDFVGIDTLLQNISIGTLLFSLGTISIIIAKFFKP